MIFTISTLSLAAALMPQQTITDSEGNTRELTVTETVAVEGAQIAQAVVAFGENEENRLRKFVSKDGGIVVYTDFSKSEGKNFMKAVETMLERMDHAFGEAPKTPQSEKILIELREAGLEVPASTDPLLSFLFVDPAHYHGLLDVVKEVAPSQRDFMARSKNTTGFTIFAPELTCYFHDTNFQEEAIPERSLAHNLAHLGLNRRYGILPLWVREGIATALEDMCWGEVYGPWYLNGFVFSSSHGDWRGRDTKEAVAELTDVIGTLYSYKANPYRNDLARLSFAWATYAMLEQPEGIQTFLRSLQDLYITENRFGGNPTFSKEQYQEAFHAAFGSEFLADMQKWWKKPPRWNAKPKKKKRS